MIFDIEYETMPREALETIQLRRLQATVERVYATVPFYHKRFEEAGITPGDIGFIQGFENGNPFQSVLEFLLLLLHSLMLRLP